VVSVMSPLKIRRNPDNCSGCRRCSDSCPAGLSIHTQKSISSPECTGCLTCVAGCPDRQVLQMAPSFRHRPLPVWFFPCLVVVLFVAGVGSGMATGHWNSILTYADYQRLIPIVRYLGH